MSKIRLGAQGYRGRPEGWEGDELGEIKNKELVELGRAVWIEEPEEEKPKKRKRGRPRKKRKVLTPAKKGTYNTK